MWADLVDKVDSDSGGFCSKTVQIAVTKIFLKFKVFRAS